jgi:hypothetical protein
MERPGPQTPGLFSYGWPVVRRAVGLALLLSLIALPGTAGAHFGGAASIIVPLDHINLGEPFPVIAADLGASAGVTFQLQRTDRTLDLGRVTAGPDGHFQSTFDLPSDFPLGYVELVAASDDGSRASTWVLVGPRTNLPPAAPNQTQWWQDPATLLMLALVVGGLIALEWAFIRSRRRERALAPSAVRRPGPRKSRRR